MKCPECGGKLVAKESTVSAGPIDVRCETLACRKCGQEWVDGKKLDKLTASRISKLLYFERKVARGGGSLFIRIPIELVRLFDIKNGSPIEIFSMKDGFFVRTRK